MGVSGQSGAVDARLARQGSAPALATEAFGRAFRQHFRTLWLIACGVTRKPDLAEDVVQEAAVIALRKLAEFDPNTSFVAWMGQIVRFVAMNQSRREQRRRAVPLEAAAEPAAGTTSEEAGAGGGFDPNWFDDRVLAALAEIAEIPRACLLLRTVQGLSYAEISAALDVPAGTAMSHVFRSRQTLRRKLGSATRGD
ncbi:MAG: RNA polymerase sigma factor [Phycisphaerales bacterium]|nr:RNA polymerase sigma factor [Phycisphaerales bacterium]